MLVSDDQSALASEQKQSSDVTGTPLLLRLCRLPIWHLWCSFLVILPLVSGETNGRSKGKGDLFFAPDKSGPPKDLAMDRPCPV
ncbi:hypothetical protein GDO86_004709 [Hymenochirus boettgeri]|uniref:Uncharacterized protein n=1 Tax=Hymenochirus boettgeri TaxID=247094 RepID=A0A8T2K718_9PIPI|nr:hypothetical protein GDO86_004709 [Hymenochirus boettgeri]